MTAKANQVDVKVDEVLAKVDKAADEAIKQLETGGDSLVDALGLAGNFGKNLSDIGGRLRNRLGVSTNFPPSDGEDKKKGWLK